MNFENHTNNLEKENKETTIKKFLQKNLNLEKKEAERINLLPAFELPAKYQDQLKNFDKKVQETDIAVIPDKIWHKENQPTESWAEKNLILVKESYLNDPEEKDEIGWVTHELAHCEIFKNSENEQEYEAKRRTLAFEDSEAEDTYPNNIIEEQAFSKQFRYLKEERGEDKESIKKMLKNYYEKEDFNFFDKLLKKIFD